ncbi:hypothetical protein RRG08_029317 [Elysia crispata]|uniref:Ig-like domain-containing protein n=1 Tax=Elysia crispata TaxID=231223 RepID=A0AAE1AS47_9GAST|nr:hypothetical protein RRG08_029317 [Elysia crispata]
MGSVATVQPSCKSAVTALEFTQRGHQGYLKMLSTVHKGTEEPAQVKVHCPGWCQLVLLVKIVTVLRAQAGLAVVLCCILGLGAAASTTIEVVYRLHCPQQCVCMHGQDKTPSAEISSVNCSARAVHQNNTLLVFSNNTQNVTRAADKRLNGSSAVSIQPRLKFLDLSHNNLSGMSADFFQSEQPLTSVDYLYLNDNAIQALQDASFEHYVGLQFLDLSHNDISMVSERAFEGLENLTWLDLSHNSISALSNSLFHSLINLQSLDLSHNQLQTVNNLQALSSLEYLYLQHNNLRLVKAANPILLPSMPSLSYLDLSHNPLKITQAGMFETTARLKTLDMSRCSISHLHHQFLAGVPLLTVLRLDENNISSIASPVFQNTSLTSLSLTSMPNLANLSHNTFLGLSKLASLNLSQNQDLSFVHPHLFSPLAHLTQVDLSYCSISLLSQITFHYNLALKEVYLGSNPFACSCANAWLVEKITIGNTSHFKDLDSLTCVNESSGQTEQIAQASFHCEKISLHNITSRVSVPLGGQIMLKCGHSSAGQPGMVKWTTPGGKVLLQHDFHPDAISHLLTQEDVQPDADYHKGHYWHSSSSYYPHLSGREDRVIILADGSLFIDYMLRSDTGPYACQVSNAKYNKSATVVLLLDYKVSGEIQIFAIIVGFLCALGFFTLNLIYVIISWIARRLVNKRRREIIRQMLENMNAYKSTQITRIQENYTYQLGRVRNQYHMQRDRLHRNYTQQVTKMKRGCSNQVEKVRENYTSRLAQLRDYSSNQIVQIRERANNQIIRIRDYGTSQLEKLRETYKLQHLHVMKLLDTMNLDNCRHIVETECMRAESMMFDVDLLGEDMRTDSPVSGADSEYTTPDTSPAPSLEVNASQGLSQDMAQQEQPRKKILHPARDSPPILLEMQATINMEAGLALDVADQWEYCSDLGQGKYAPHRYLMNMYIPGKDKNETILQLQSDADIYEKEEDENAADLVKENFPLPTLLLRDDEEKITSRTLREQDPTQSSPFMTPEASPTKRLQPYRIQSADPQGHDTDVSDETNL